MLIKYSNLKQKDLDYMNFILKNGIVTAKHIFLNFEENNMDAVYRRLRKLKDGGYVKHHTIVHKVGVYYGTMAAKEATEARVTLPDGPSIYTIKHTLLMVDLILYFQLRSKKEGKEFSYRSEREIRFEALKTLDSKKPMVKRLNEIKDRYPDCIFHHNGQKIWVELELHQKDNNRYREKFKERFEPALLNGEYDLIYYFTDVGRIKTAVEKAREKLSFPKKLKVYDIPKIIKNDTWEEVMTSGKTEEPGSGSRD